MFFRIVAIGAQSKGRPARASEGQKGRYRVSARMLPEVQHTHAFLPTTETLELFELELCSRPQVPARHPCLHTRVLAPGRGYFYGDSHPVRGRHPNAHGRTSLGGAGFSYKHVMPGRHGAMSSLMNCCLLFVHPAQQGSDEVHRNTIQLTPIAQQKYEVVVSTRSRFVGIL